MWIVGKIRKSEIDLYPHLYIPKSSIGYKIDINNYKEHILKERNI